MADKGFDVHNLCAGLGVHVNISPFRQAARQMIPADVATTKKIAGVCIHVERKV